MNILSILVAFSIISCTAKEQDSEGASSKQWDVYYEFFKKHEIYKDDEQTDFDLIGGVVVSPEQFPATLYTRNFRNNGTISKCTGTVVGEKTLLIAAHCVEQKGKIEIAVKGKKYNGICDRNPTYNTSHTADYALCLMEKKIEGIAYENLNDDPSYVKIGDKVLLTGYGCIKPGGTGGNDGKLRIGEATIQRVPVKGRTSNDYVTVGAVALCFGDSGGPAYKVEGMKRKIISVNSRGDIATTSYLSSVTTKEAMDFFKAWMIENDQMICGIHSAAIGCR